MNTRRDFLKTATMSGAILGIPDAVVSSRNEAKSASAKTSSTSSTIAIERAGNMLTCGNDGRGLTLTLKSYGESWTLDEASIRCADALYGCPPAVFPFGASYHWTGKGRESVLYRHRFDDPETQFALRLAKEVADLHARIGKLEMTKFEFLTRDGCLQRTTFSNGLQVCANFDVQGSPWIDGVSGMPPESWQIIEP